MQSKAFWRVCLLIVGNKGFETCTTLYLYYLGCHVYIISIRKLDNTFNLTFGKLVRALLPAFSPWIIRSRVPLQACITSIVFVSLTSHHSRHGFKI